MSDAVILDPSLSGREPCHACLTLRGPRAGNVSGDEQVLVECRRLCDTMDCEEDGLSNCVGFVIVRLGKFIVCYVRLVSQEVLPWLRFNASQDKRMALLARRSADVLIALP